MNASALLSAHRHILTRRRLFPSLSLSFIKRLPRIKRSARDFLTTPMNSLLVVVVGTTPLRVKRPGGGDHKSEIDLTPSPFGQTKCLTMEKDRLLVVKEITIYIERELERERDK